MRDNDAKFSAQFDEVLKSSGAIVKRNTPLSRNLRAHMARFIQTLTFEFFLKQRVTSPVAFRRSISSGDGRIKPRSGIMCQQGKGAMVAP